MYEELLSLCGFTKSAQMSETGRILKAFEMAGINEKDVHRAVDRIKKYFDIELEGVRKLLGVWLKEFVCIILAKRERKKIIHSTLPSLGGNPIAVANLMSNDFYAGFPDVVCIFVLSSIFGKGDDIFGAAEADALPSGYAHCGLNQFRLGRYLTGLGVKPDLHVCWGIFCDEAPKLDEIISERFDVPTVFINRCQDGWEVVDGVAQVPERSIAFTAAEVKRAVERMSEVLGAPITEAMLMESLIKLFELYGLWVELGLLMKSDPMPISQVDLNLVHFATVICFQHMDELLDGCRLLLKELRERVAAQIGPYEKGCPRVFLAGIPSLADPAIVKLVEAVGLGICCTEYQVFGPSGGPRFDLGDMNELMRMGPYEIIVRIFSKNNIFAGLIPQIETLGKAFKFWSIDGILWHIHTNCRTYSSNALMLKDAFAKLYPDIPFIIIEGDLYDSRAYHSEQMRVRIETFADMVKFHRKDHRWDS